MTSGVTRREVVVVAGDVTLAGTLWLPASRQVATVLMHPGSGPADRDNGSYFVPIRAQLLQSGCAVCSFDKRGVGGSSGQWQDADIATQAQDVMAVLDSLVADTSERTPVGLFGHSQGGWVVVEAAYRHASVAFVVTNSGPGVSPASQERYSARCAMARAGLSDAEINEKTRRFDLEVSLMRAGVPFDQARLRLEAAADSTPDNASPTRFFAVDADEWRFASAIIDYDPRAALREIRVPMLAVFGSDDTTVPVDQSVSAYRESVRPDLLSVRVFAGADHRIRNAATDAPADGYLQALSDFVAGVSSSRP